MNPKVTFLCFWGLFPVFHTAMAIAAGVALHKDLDLDDAILTIFVAIIGVLALLTTFLYDLQPSDPRGYCFPSIPKIWIQWIFMLSLLGVDILNFYNSLKKNNDHPCFCGDSDDANTHVKPCLNLQLIWAFQALTIATVFFCVGSLSALVHDEEHLAIRFGRIRSRSSQST